MQYLTCMINTGLQLTTPQANDQKHDNKFKNDFIFLRNCHLNLLGAEMPTSPWEHAFSMCITSNTHATYCGKTYT